MVRILRSRTVWSAALCALTFNVVGCGDDDKKDDDDKDSGEKWTAEVVKVAAGKAEVGFDGAAEGQQFVLMPLTLGDPAAVEGGGDGPYAFKLAASSGSLRMTTPKASRHAMSLSEYDHGKRTLLNRFDRKKGENQGEWFWSLARRLDEEGPGANLRESVGPGAIENSYRKMARDPLALTERLNVTTAGTCPEAGDDVVMPKVSAPQSPEDKPVPAGGAVSGDGYCIVYMDAPVTGGTKAEIEATIKTVVTRYKEVIYKDDFATVNDYAFNPTFVIVNFDKTAGKWPTANNLQVAGVFIGGMSEDAGMPMIYMSSDLSKVENGGTDAAKNKALWHGTIAHETQHAIIDYFRVRVAEKEGEVPSIDEGLAHYMEDLFGYGSENFADYAGNYLQNWANDNPAIHATDSGDTERGAAQAFLYYLTSQKGGITFTDGVVSGGTGLDYISEIVKNSGGKRGPANLSAKLGGDWLSTVANYYGALLLDGTDRADTSLTVQDPEKINDLTGGTDKTFGMHFNGFLANFDAKSQVTATTADTTEVEISSYATSPVIYTVKDPAAKVTFTTEQDAANTAVVKVRIK